MSDPRKFRFSIDRGGTFTDIYAEIPTRNVAGNAAENDAEPGFMTLKLLSEDPANYPDAPREGIRLRPYNNPKPYRNRGEAYLDTRKYKKAVDDFDEVIWVWPSNPDAFLHRGKAFMGKGEYDRAIADFSKAIKLNPVKAPYFKDRAETYLKMGQMKKACADWRKASELDPKMKIEGLKEKC